VQQQADSQKELLTIKRRITTIKNELGHFGVPEKRMNHIGRLAWAATKTDFTQAEQDERQLLLLKVRSIFSSVWVWVCRHLIYALFFCCCSRSHAPLLLNLQMHIFAGYLNMYISYEIHARGVRE
jgi:hypothetical protein